MTPDTCRICFMSSIFGWDASKSPDDITPVSDIVRQLTPRQMDSIPPPLSCSLKLHPVLWLGLVASHDWDWDLYHIGCHLFLKKKKLLLSRCFAALTQLCFPQRPDTSWPCTSALPTLRFSHQGISTRFLNFSKAHAWKECLLPCKHHKPGGKFCVMSFYHNPHETSICYCGKDKMWVRIIWKYGIWRRTWKCMRSSRAKKKNIEAERWFIS